MLQIELDESVKQGVRVAVFALTLNEHAAEVLRESHYRHEDSMASNALTVIQTNQITWAVERPEESCSVGLVVKVDGFQARALVVEPTEWKGTRPIRVDLSPSPGLKIRVVDDLAKPIPGARVHIRSDDLGLAEGSETSDLFERRWFWETLTSNSAGSVVLASPPAGLVSVYVEPQGQYSSCILWEQPSTGELTVVLNKAYAIRGTLTDSAGTPVSGASLSVFWTDGRWSEQPLQSAETDERGQFSFQQLPADGGIHYIMLHDPRFAASRSDPYVARPGELLQIAMETQEARAALLKLEYADAQPLRLVSCEMISESGGRIPATLIADNGGLVNVPGYVTMGQKYFLRLNVSGCPVESDSFMLDSEITTVHIEGVGELTALELADSIALGEGSVIDFYPDSDREGYCASFTLDALPTIIPSGAGLISLETAGGGIWTETVMMPEAASARLTVSGASALLKFSIAATNFTDVEVRGVQRHLIVRFSDARPVFTASVAPGDYVIQIHYPSETEECGPFLVPIDGADLGPIDLNSGGEIRGFVGGPGGAPVSEVPIVAYGAFGYRSDYAYSGPDGRYSITGLPAGAYRVECPGASILGGQSPTISQPVLVGCGASLDGINFSLVPSGVKVHYDVNPDGFAVGALLIIGEQCHIVRGVQCRELRALRFKSMAVGGFWEQRTNELDVHLLELEEGFSEYSVSRQSLREFSLDVSLSSGSKDFSTVLFRIAGLTPIASVAPNQDGKILVRTNRPDLVECLMDSASERLGWRPITQELQRPKFLKFRVLNSSAEPIVGAMVASRRTEARAYTDSIGNAQVSTSSEDWIWIDHSQYWAVQRQSGAAQEDIVLRRSCAAEWIPFEIIPDHESLALIPMFDLGYDLSSLGLVLTKGELGWRLPVIPSGNYYAEVVTADGSQVRFELDLPELGPVRRL